MKSNQVRSIFTRLREKKHITEDGCWEFTGTRQGGGYGQIRYGGKNQVVHRVAYKKYVGPIPPGALVRHTCDNPICFNPEHLVLGTHQDNTDDMVSRNRQNFNMLNTRKRRK